MGYTAPMDQDLTTSRPHAAERNNAPAGRRPAFEIIHNAPTAIETFKDWVAAQPKEDGKYELSRGQVTRMQAGVRRSHSMVATNILGFLIGALDRAKFHISANDFGVQTPFGMRYPDVMVEPRLSGPALKERQTKSPLFIAEVLSPSTTDIDFLDKAPEYMAMTTLHTYLIASPDEPCVWVYSRGPDGWPARPQRIINDLAAIVPLGGLDINLPVAALYRDLDFADE
jgi:Uma2 family endonuclease